MVMPALRAIEPDDHGADHPHFHDHEDLPRHGGRFESILDAIGYTPLVEIPRMSPNPAVAGQAVVVVEMRVTGAVAVWIAAAHGRHDHRPQPPAIAGSSRTSSAGATGVSRPARYRTSCPLT